MRFFVFCDDAQWKELFPEGQEIYLNPPADQELNADDVLVDLREDAWDLPLYHRCKGLVFISSVAQTLAGHHAPPHWIRINGWPGMLGRPAIEAAGDPAWRGQAEERVARLGRSVIWVDDIPGMVSPRTLAMIINEACLALEEQVSDRPSIDLAMKRGTNYPKGPFEWADSLGWPRIRQLLDVLASQDPLYQPAKSFLP